MVAILIVLQASVDSRRAHELFRSSFSAARGRKLLRHSSRCWAALARNKSLQGSFIHPSLTVRAGRTGHVLGTELKTSRRSDGGESGRRSERRESNSRAQHGRFVTRAKLVILLEPFQVQFAIGTVSAKDHCNKPLRLRCMVYAAGPSSPRAEVRPVRALPDSGERGGCQAGEQESGPEGCRTAGHCQAGALRKRVFWVGAACCGKHALS